MDCCILYWRSNLKGNSQGDLFWLDRIDSRIGNLQVFKWCQCSLSLMVVGMVHKAMFRYSKSLQHLISFSIHWCVTLQSYPFRWDFLSRPVNNLVDGSSGVGLQSAFAKTKGIITGAQAGAVLCGHKQMAQVWPMCSWYLIVCLGRSVITVLCRLTSNGCSLKVVLSACLGRTWQWT